MTACSYCSCDGAGRNARNSSSGPAATNTRVRAADGVSITVYVILIYPAVAPRATRRTRAWCFRREGFRTRCLFCATVISHRLGCRALPGHQISLMRSMILSPLLAALVFRARKPMTRGLREVSAALAAVGLPPVVRSTDVEPHPASAANQLVDNELVHPLRRDENWTATSGASTVRMYWLSIRWPYTRVQALTWTLLRFIRRLDLPERSGPRDFLS